MIDDARLIADTLTKIFLNEGYEARSAYSAEEALNLLDREEWIPALAIIEEWIPALAIIDVQLPGMNGVDLAILLKAKYPRMRLRLLSGHAMTTDRIEAARQKGYLFDITAKPAHPTVFLEVASSL